MVPLALALLRNLALLVALTAAYHVVLRRWRRDDVARSLVCGLLFGAVTVAGMADPFQLAPGLVFDGRSVVLSVAGLFGGPLVAAAAVAVAAAYRFWMGGLGAPVGAAVIASSAALGVLFRGLRARGVPVTNTPWLWGLGVVVHLAMLGIQLLLPGKLGPAVLRHIAFPVIVLYPAATVLVAWLFLQAEEWTAAADTLRQSEARYRSLFEGHPAPMLLVDPKNGAIADANPAAARYYGWSREELTGKPIQEINTLPPAEMAAEMAAAAERSSHFQFRHRRADGSVRDVEVYSGPVEVGGRRLLHSLVVDATDRRQAEEAAQELGALVENSRNEVYLFDRETLGFRWANRGARENLGYSLDELRGLSALDIKPDLTAQDFRELLRPLADGGESLVRFESRHRRKDGTLYPVDVTVQAVSYRGRPCYVAFILDSTRRQELEAQLRQAQKMEAVGQLAGGIAHDFNNLLQVILGQADLLAWFRSAADRGTPRPPSSPETETGADREKAAVDAIRRAAERAAGLTGQLLAFSRRQVLVPQVVQPNALVADAERLLRRLIGEDIDLVTLLAPDAGCIRVDPGQFQQVILNLAVNARDAMPRGGSLTIETANVDLDEAYAATRPGCRPGPYVMLAVSDTGVGMDAETLGRAFDPFFTTKEIGKGTGLGLATVYGVVKQSDGDVWGYSEPGRGTTFKAFFPRTDEAVTTEGSEASSEQEPRGADTVLLAEDEDLVRDSVATMLRQAGYTVVEAANGQSALEAARAHPSPIALLITDVVMPGMGGRDLAQTLAAERPALRVLFLSGYTDDAVVRHGILEHRVAFLQKPFTRPKLLAKVREVLAGPPFSSPSRS